MSAHDRHGGGRGKRPRRLAVIPCSGPKIWDTQPQLGPVAAAEVYTSPYHRLCRAHALRVADAWVILSARHGFLRPSDLVPGPYDVTFSRPGDPCVSDAQLLAQVGALGLDRFDEITAVCPDDYARRVERAFEHSASRLVFPLRGLGGIDAQQAFLEQAAELAREARPGGGYPPRTQRTK